MADRTTSETDEASTGNGEPVQEQAEQRAEERAKTLRRELDVLLDELRMRGKRAFDVKYQIQKHPALLAGAGALVLAGVGFGIAQFVGRQRRRQSVTARLAALSALVQERAAAGITAARTGPSRKSRRKAGRISGRKGEQGEGAGSLIRAALAIALPRLLPLVISRVMQGRKQDARTRALGLPADRAGPSPSRPGA